MIRATLLLASVLALVGCASMQNAVPTAREQEEHELIALIDYARHVSTMNAQQRRAEYSASDAAFAKKADRGNRMRLALLLALSGNSMEDAERATALLEPVLAPDDTPGLVRVLAGLLYAQIETRAQEHKRAGRLQVQLDAHKEAEQFLRKQLEELKEIERTILQRTQESRPRRK